MIQVTFYSLHICFRRVVFKKLAQNYVFQFSLVQYSSGRARVAMQLLNNT